MRLIDAEHLKRWILARWEKTDSRSAYPLRAIDIIDQVDREDTIDAEPVRHGKWIEHHEPYTWMGYTYWSCSECGFECGYEKDITIRTKYCPHCGAKLEQGWTEVTDNE